MSTLYNLSSVSSFSPFSFKTKSTCNSNSKFISSIQDPKASCASEPLLLSSVGRENVERPPAWIMRQAGRCIKAERHLHTPPSISAYVGNNSAENGCSWCSPLFSRTRHSKHIMCFASSGETTETEQVEEGILDSLLETKAFAVPRRQIMTTLLSSYVFAHANSLNTASALQSVGLREYIDTFDGYSFKYPKNWIQVKGANADIFFRDPFILDENLSLELSSPSSSNYKSIEDLGPPEVAGKNVLKQYLTEFMSTRLGVRRESSILSTSSRVADDGKMYYQVEVNIKSYANNNELAVMPQDRVARLEWDRHYLSVLGVENNQLYVLRLQVPEKVFVEEESDLRQILDSFRVNKVIA